MFVVGLGMVGIGTQTELVSLRRALLTAYLAFIEKLLNLDVSMQYRVVTCGEEVHRTQSSSCRSYSISYCYEPVAYNRVALTEYFQHRNVEKLYLNQGNYCSASPTDRMIDPSVHQPIGIPLRTRQDSSSMSVKRSPRFHLPTIPLRLRRVGPSHMTSACWLQALRLHYRALSSERSAESLFTGTSLISTTCWSIRGRRELRAKP